MLGWFTGKKSQKDSDKNPKKEIAKEEIADDDKVCCVQLSLG